MLNLNREIKMPRALYRDTLQGSNDSIEPPLEAVILERNARMHALIGNVKENLEKAYQNQARYYNLRRLLERRSLLAPAPPTIWSFDSIFLVAWRQCGFARVKRWTGEQNILDRDVILFPVHLEEEFHWVLAAAFPKILEIHIYDSLRRSRPKLTKEIQSYLSEYATFRKSPTISWTLVPSSACLQQSPDGNDCGSFVCFFAEQILKRQSTDEVEFNPREYRKTVTTALRRTIIIRNEPLFPLTDSQLETSR
ncbi:sentrin-specific protease-like [Macrosteles quadrilineatus]|uniref:sentrin-specific protease-like n=1 Tax=Macrosteles quadrilineatus TaxID=74068 RepID=UPI0023E11161|nr:sentrin-specific protease-like [Macrosteles quadrilineatus]